MDKNTLENLSKIDIPDIAKGTALPLSVYEKQIQDAKEKELRRQQWKHDFHIALFSVLAGGIAGFITSAILLHLQGLL